MNSAVLNILFNAFCWTFVCTCLGYVSGVNFLGHGKTHMFGFHKHCHSFQKACANPRCHQQCKRIPFISHPGWQVAFSIWSQCCSISLQFKFEFTWFLIKLRFFRIFSFHVDNLFCEVLAQVFCHLKNCFVFIFLCNLDFSVFFLIWYNGCILPRFCCCFSLS